MVVSIIQTVLIRCAERFGVTFVFGVEESRVYWSQYVYCWEKVLEHQSNPYFEY